MRYHSNPELLRETSTKPSNALLNGHEGVAFSPIAFQLFIILRVDSPLGVLRQHFQSVTIRMMQFFSMTCTNDHNRFANVKQISVYQMVIFVDLQLQLGVHIMLAGIVIF
jgi:hypothetical protein